LSVNADSLTGEPVPLAVLDDRAGLDILRRRST
jgi:hypothetical protein